MKKIIRLAAKGDGVDDAGGFHRLAVPGDTIGADGAIIRGPDHVEPPCRHFGSCGGCELQHCSEGVLREFVRNRVVNVAMGHELDPQEMLEVHLSPPSARRRAKLHGLRTKNGAVMGYKAAGSHKIVDAHECHVIAPAIGALLCSLRKLIAQYGPRNGIEAMLSLCDQGVDLALAHFPFEGLAATEALTEFAKDHVLARVTVEQGYGPETVWEPEPVTVGFAGFAVPMPPGAFLQATPDAEHRLVEDACAWMGDARITADLFAGLGTFAFALARAGVSNRKVLAVEADRAAHLACKAASAQTGGAVLTLHRDLFRNPLQADELNKFHGVLLDPPRAGAKAQIAQIAQSDLGRVVYVSCNPSSWARDGAVLKQAGFALKSLRPVGQFRWSTHVELVSLFERG